MRHRRLLGSIVILVAICGCWCGGEEPQAEQETIAFDRTDELAGTVQRLRNDLERLEQRVDDQERELDEAKQTIRNLEGELEDRDRPRRR